MLRGVRRSVLAILTRLVMAWGEGLLFADLGGRGFLVGQGRRQVLVFQRSVFRGRLRLGGYSLGTARLLDVMVFSRALLPCRSA